MKSAVALFGLLFALWLLSSGHYKDPLLISIGVVSCTGVVLLCRKMGIIDPESVPVHLTLRGLRYLPWLVRAVVQANFDVVRRVLSPSLPISPELLVLRPTQKTKLGRVIYANSITLTPGTVSVMTEGDTLLVHAIARQAAAGLEDGEMDRRVTRLEGLA